MKISVLAVITSVAVSVSFAGTSMAAKVAKDPFEGMFATEAQFDGLINQNEPPVGARLLRTSRNAAGVGYALGDSESKSRTNSVTSKATSRKTDSYLFGILAFKNGLRLGLTHSSKQMKIKFDDISAKYIFQSTAVSLAAAVRSGLGLGLTFEQNKDEIKAEIFGIDIDRDATWAIIRPELYYAGRDFDLVLRYSPTMRHETISREAFTELEGEKVIAEGMHLLATVRHLRSSETDDDEKNHFKAAGGIRFFYDEQHSNVSAQLELEDAYAAGPSNGSSGNIAKNGILVDLEHFATAMHVVGGGVQYRTGTGKASDGNDTDKLSMTETIFVASYSARF